MPEEGWVLKCFSCSKFQVQLKKKAKKWQCKVCGKKQDLMTIFFKGQPKDCRTNVQNLNKAEGEKYEKLQEQSFKEDYNHDLDESIVQSSHSEFFSDENEIFTEAVVTKKECIQDNENYFQEDFNFSNNFYEVNTASPQKFTTVISGGLSKTDSLKADETNPNDFTEKNIMFQTKSHNVSSCENHSSNSKPQETKSSIFESNCDFDESFDF